MSPDRTLCTGAVLCTLMLLCACSGTSAGSPPSSSSSPRGSSTSANPDCPAGVHAVCLTRSDSGHTVTVGVGWTVSVSLLASSTAWSTPSETGHHLLRQIGGVRRDAAAVDVAYRAIAPGRTALRAFERPICLPGRACPQFILLWQVDIRVGGR